MPQLRREAPRPIGLTGTGIVQDCHQVHQFVPRAELRGTDASVRLLASAVASALTDAGHRLRTPDCEGIGLFVGQTRVSPESVCSLWQEYSRPRSNAPFSTGLYAHGLQLRDRCLL